MAPKYEDGTNVLAGTEFLAETSRTTDWYFPAESTAPPRWEGKWGALRSRFERLVDQYRPLESVLVQTRVPAHARDSVARPPESAGGDLLLGGGGLQREPSQLFTTTRQPLFGAFPTRDANGKPMCNSAGDPFGFRFGLFRQIDIHVSMCYLTDARPIPHPELQELACDATGLLYGLPGPVAKSIWRNWLSGFSRRQNSGEYLWFDALFELAWRRQPGGPLYAKRKAWIENGSVVLDGSGLFPRLPEFPDWPLLEKLPHENGYPMAYYSIIPDVARASVSTIDEIMEFGRTCVERPDQPMLRVERNSDLNTATRTDVFISYSHKDDRWRNDLEKHLKPYVRNGSITAWSDKQITPGSKSLEEIKSALSRTRVAVLLVTPDFLASDFIHEQELTPLLKAAENEGVRILWIPVYATSYMETGLKKYQALCDPAKPLAEMKAERQRVWVAICQEIKSAANP